MIPPSASVRPGGLSFQQTRWTVVFLSARGGTGTTPQAEDALADLYRTYWPPLYAFVRRRGYGVADAQDLTQDFFVGLLQGDALTRVDPARGRFRSFLLTALKNFLAKDYERRGALKRGGRYQFLPLDEAIQAEAEAAVRQDAGAAAGGEERQFEERWAAALVARTLRVLRATLADEGKEGVYDELQVYVTGVGPLPDQAQVAARLGLPFATLRTHIHRLRERYRQTLRAEVARTVATSEEVDDELRHLLRVLTGTR